MIDSHASKPAAPMGWHGVVADYVALTKPRIMSLLLLTTLTGMVLAAGGFPAALLIAAVIAGGACASGGASALNHWLDRDIDRSMGRTKRRPVAAGRVAARDALIFGLGLSAVAFVVLAVGANLLAALLAMAGSAFYVIVYTIWLKRSSMQNIVIGGAAGAIPPLVGWAAVTGGLSLPAWYLFAIIFFWTPPHFWALALILRDDYRAAGIPMLPVVAGEDGTRWSIFLYTLLLMPLTLLLGIVTHSLDVIYLSGAGVLGVLFIALSARLLRNQTRQAALGLYKYSLLYLAILCVLIMADANIA